MHKDTTNKLMTGFDPPTFEPLDNLLYHLGNVCPLMLFLFFQQSRIASCPLVPVAETLLSLTEQHWVRASRMARTTGTHTQPYNLHSECKEKKRYFQKARGKCRHIASFPHTPLPSPKHIRFLVGTQHKRTRLTHIDTSPRQAAQMSS